MNEEPVAGTNPAEGFANSETLTKLPVRSNRRIGCLMLCAAFGLFLVLLGPSFRLGPGGWELGRRLKCTDNLKKIALALSQYEEAYGAFPPAHIFDSSGKPLHSWRTLILPFLSDPEERKRYESIDLSKPWDDPANARVGEYAPSVYRCPGNKGDKRSDTNYLAVVVPGGWFLPTQPRQENVISAEHGNSVLVVEVTKDRAVHWMSPADVDEQMVLRVFREPPLAHYGSTQVLMADGRPKFIVGTIAPATVRELVTTQGTTNEF